MNLRFGILSVGDELLAGDIVDANASWLARRIEDRGHRVLGMAVVGDTIDAVRRAVEEAMERYDWLLVSGGLGPTADDLTRDGVAAAFGVELQERPELMEELQRSGRRVTEGAARQAVMPVGAEVLANSCGTAPGFVARRGRLSVACMPGVPSELKVMADALLAERVPKGGVVPTRRLLACGITEAELGDRIADLMDPSRAGCRVGVTATQGLMRISVRGEDREAVDAAFEEARRRLGVALLGEGDDTLAGVLVAELARRGLSVTTAESCTGGLLAAAITSVPGSSAVFRESAVTYANEAKIERLGVPEAMLAEHGAVSEPVAAAMADGARRRARADFALSITGIAGPDGGTPEKPVGTVVFGLADERGTVVKTRHSRGARDEIRSRSVQFALDLLRRRLAEL